MTNANPASVQHYFNEEEVETVSLTYNELVEAVEMYLRQEGSFLIDETLVFMDIPVPISDTGEIDIDFVVRK